MKRLNDYTTALQTSSELVLKLLNEWSPRPAAMAEDALKEKHHERDLIAWLRKRLPDVPVVPQYGIAKGRADIVIQDSHVIELKLGFGEASVAEFDRCIGQMERYLQKWVRTKRGPVYLVVVGESDTEFRDLLRRWFKEANSRCPGFAFFSEEPFYLVEKRANT